MLKFIDNNKEMILSGDSTMDPGFDEYDINSKKENAKMTITEFNELKKKYCIYDGIEEIFDFVSELLHRRAKEIERAEPYATRTINNMNIAAYEVDDLIDYVSEMEEERMITKESIYDEMCRVLTDWEPQDAVDDDLYNMLVKIQNNWETVITAQEEN